MRSYKDIREAHKVSLNYKLATEQLGPSQQLIRFIDPKGELIEELGLESIDTLVIHEVILTEYDSDTLRESALEALADTIGSVVKFSGGFIKDGIFGFVRGQIGAKLVLGAISLTSILAGKIKRTFKERGFVEPYSELKNMVKLYSNLVESLTSLAKEFPTNHDHDTWSNFLDKNLSDHIDGFAAIEETMDSFMNVTRVDFEHSGWNERNFIDITKHILAISNKFSIDWGKFTSKATSLEHWTKSANNDEMEIADLISEAIHRISKLVHITENLTHRIKAIESRVAHHFTEIK